MSGIVAVVRLAGASIDRDLVRRMTDSMSFRGPDAQETWCDDGAADEGGRAGLGHALLRATAESEREAQPATLDGRVWITADVRLDGRGELLRMWSSSCTPTPHGARPASSI
jgi:asparagine synthase (glutamine-hydrolysing)